MKRNQFLSLSILFFSSFAASAQNNQSDNLVTSGGLSAGYNIPYVGGPSVAGGQTYYGYEAGKSIFAKRSGANTFIGCQSGYSNVIGAYNTSLGYQSGYSNEMGVTMFLLEPRLVILKRETINCISKIQILQLL